MESLRVGLVLALTVWLVSPARAGTHEDTIHGFKIKPPRGYEGVALSPGDTFTLAKFASDQREVDAEWTVIPTFEVAYHPDELLREDQTREEYVLELWDAIERLAGHGEVERDELRVEREDYEVRHIVNERSGLAYFALMMPQDDGCFVLFGTTLASRYDKARRDFIKAARSFERIEKEGRADREAAYAQMSEQERFLAEQISRLPDGWYSHRTERYLFLYNAEKRFVEELGDQIEAIRDVYEEIWVPDAPIEAVSIVRVCGSRDDYYAYGGRPGTGGYWNSAERELVIFDSPPRDFVRAVLNHEAFHQYIFYFYGELAPASWYNEGTGDYFAGAKMTRSYRIKEFADAPGGVGRKETAKEACRLLQAGRTDEPLCATPLEDLLRYSQAEYYARGGVHYAQGWALVHFLRESKRLEPEWERIYDDYLLNLVAARAEIAEEIRDEAVEDAEKKEPGSSAELPTDPAEWYAAANRQRGEDIRQRAYQKTFEGWTDEDWDEFNEAYLEYVEKL